MRSHHDVLGVRPNAGREEIELAYKGRRSQYHPDRYAQADQETQAWATACMQEVNAAYEALINGRPSAASEAAASRQPAGQPTTSSPMTLGQALRAHPISKAGMARIYIAPNIPLKKLHNALESYGHGLKPSDVLVLLDDTIFSSGKDGLLVTERELRVKEAFNPPETFALDGIALGIRGGDLYVNNHRARDFNITERGEVEAFVRALSEVLKVRTSTPQRTPVQPTATPTDHPEGVPGYRLEALFPQINEQFEQQLRQANASTQAGRKLIYMLHLMSVMLALTGQLKGAAEAARGAPLQPNDASWCRCDVVRLELVLYQAAWISHALRNRYGLSEDDADEEMLLISMFVIVPAVAGEAGYEVDNDAAMEALMASSLMTVAKQRMQHYFDRMEGPDQPASLLEGLRSPVAFQVDGPDARHREQWAALAHTICGTQATEQFLHAMRRLLQHGLDERFGGMQ